MKKIAVLIAVLGASIAAYASNIAVVNARQVMDEYSQTKIIYKALDDKRKAMEIEISKDEVAIQQKQIELNAKTSVTEAEKTAYQTMVNNFQKKITTKQQELTKEETTKMQEIQTKINTAVTNVAKAGKYDLVLEFNAVMYGKATDITTAVITEINKGTPAPKK
ncbi:MAG: OmpH family outer membrane protein [Fusobacteriaceae bacterium]|jgi:outer membrane protein|nr:OmpH family outer membrane protein [Fusobacteriaceae bacterium]